MIGPPRSKTFHYVSAVQLRQTNMPPGTGRFTHITHALIVPTLHSDEHTLCMQHNTQYAIQIKFTAGPTSLERNDSTRAKQIAKEICFFGIRSGGALHF